MNPEERFECHFELRSIPWSRCCIVLICRRKNNGSKQLRPRSACTVGKDVREQLKDGECSGCVQGEDDATALEKLKQYQLDSQNSKVEGSLKQTLNCDGSRLPKTPGFFQAEFSCHIRFCKLKSSHENSCGPCSERLAI